MSRSQHIEYGRHKTLDKAAKPIITFLDNVGCVERVVLGHSTGNGSAMPVGTIRFRRRSPTDYESEAVLNFSIRTGRGITKMAVFCTSPEKAAELRVKLLKLFGGAT